MGLNSVRPGDSAASQLYTWGPQSVPAPPTTHAHSPRNLSVVLIITCVNTCVCTRMYECRCPHRAHRERLDDNLRYQSSDLSSILFERRTLLGHQYTCLPGVLPSLPPIPTDIRVLELHICATVVALCAF